ncbi:MAG: hypothetical protein QW429_04985, partial [Thermoprotei archaeon]
MGTEELYRKTGWIIRNLGKRQSVYRTAMYVLSHATQGILPNGEVRRPLAVETWFGSMSYNKLKVPKDDFEGIKCPICKLFIALNEWKVLKWAGPGPPPWELKPKKYYGVLTYPIENWSFDCKYERKDWYDPDYSPP